MCGRHAMWILIIFFSFFCCWFFVFTSISLSLPPFFLLLVVTFSILFSLHSTCSASVSCESCVADMRCGWCADTRSCINMKKKGKWMMMMILMVVVVMMMMIQECNIKQNYNSLKKMGQNSHQKQATRTICSFFLLFFPSLFLLVALFTSQALVVHLLYPHLHHPLPL